MSLIFVDFLTSIPDYISLAVEKNSTIAYLTICLAMFLENIIPPIPSEIIMPLGGFFVYQQKLNFYILVFWGLLGTILGSLPWYYLGRLVNELLITKLGWPVAQPKLTNLPSAKRIILFPLGSVM